MKTKIIEQIKTYRIQKGLSIKELSEQTGISYNYLYKLENGTKSNPSLSKLDRICSILGIHISILFEKI